MGSRMRPLLRLGTAQEGRKDTVEDPGNKAWHGDPERGHRAGEKAQRRDGR